MKLTLINKVGLALTILGALLWNTNSNPAMVLAIGAIVAGFLMWIHMPE